MVTENLNSGLDTAWWDAQNACFKYLIESTNSTEGTDAFLGDILWDTKYNLWTFIVSGGGQQIQNFQHPVPSNKWYAEASLLGQYENMKDAMGLAGMILNKMPAYNDKRNPGDLGSSGYMKERGIPPNVELFENTNHPELFSRMVEVASASSTSDRSDGRKKQEKMYWMVRVDFRIVYNSNQE